MSSKIARRRALGWLPWALLAVPVAIPLHASADVVPVADTSTTIVDTSLDVDATALAIPPRPIVFDDISLKTSSGLAWRRKASATRAAYDAVKVKPFMSQLELNQTPLKSRGAPGVALLDYDGDGDVDIYVTNGPGRANSLFQNQLAQTGQAKFIDVAVTAGVGAADQDSTGVCYGDIDNDGDEDLFVLGRMEPNRLFRNDGGTFSEIATSANVGGGSLGHASCTMGDINNDGLLDILVANSFDWARQDAIYTQYFAYSHRNQLYINRGANHFDDVLGSTGADKLANMPPGDSTISWAAAFVDIDQDGDVDIIHADDQAAMAPRSFGGVDRGYLQTFKNNGTGQFTNVTASMGLNSVSQWMGLAFGDLNSDGIIDMFATSMGAYFIPQVGMPIPKELTASRWWIGGANGFTDPGRGALGTTPHGWGAGMADYDNDGDTDIIFFGNMDDGPFVSADNPGAVLSNDGNANFTWDKAATAQTAERVQRSDVNGMALGDLNGDGFVDIVHASGGYANTNLPLVRDHQLWGGVFDETAYHIPTFIPIGPNEYEWSGKDTEEGILGVQISNGNSNRWVKIGVKGTKDLTTAGRVNRDGIGAIVRFTPDGGKQVLSPVLGGSSHASQHSLVQGFGLKAKTKGRAEVLWPGGVKNRLYDVMAGESVTIPEIPCDFARRWTGYKPEYTLCVNKAVNELYFRNVIDTNMASRLRDSASRAYDDAH